MNKSRNLVTVILVDEDPNLPVEYSLVHKFEPTMVEDELQTVVLELVANTDMAAILAKHNAVRAEVTTTNQLGVEIPLKPVTLKSLEFKAQ